MTNIGLFDDELDPYIQLERVRYDINTPAFGEIMDEISNFLLESINQSNMEKTFPISEIKTMLPLINNYKAKWSRRSMSGIMLANAPTVTSQPYQPGVVRVKYQLPLVLTLFTDVSGQNEDENVLYDLFAHVVPFLRYFPGGRWGVMRVQVLNQQLSEDKMDLEAKNLYYQLNLLVHGVMDYKEVHEHSSYDWELKPGGNPGGNSGGGGSSGGSFSGSSGSIRAQGKGRATPSLMVVQRRGQNVRGGGRTNQSAVVIEIAAKKTYDAKFSDLIQEKYWQIGVRGIGSPDSKDLIKISLIDMFTNKRQYRNLIETSSISQKEFSKNINIDLIRASFFPLENSGSINYSSLIFISVTTSRSDRKIWSNQIQVSIISGDKASKTRAKNLVFVSYVRVNRFDPKDIYRISIFDTEWKNVGGAWVKIVKEMQ